MLDRPINYSIYLLAKLIETLNAVLMKAVVWRDPQLLEDEFEDDEMDEPEYSPDKAEDPDTGIITLREFDLGDIYIECPECGDKDTIVCVGLCLSQYDDEEDQDAQTFEVMTVGMVAYVCGDIVHSQCLTDKVAAILNAADNHSLTIEMLANINTCDEHGVLYTEE